MAGYRAGTRYKFAKGFRRHGDTRMSNYLNTFRIGDYADIIVDGAIHKGMPHHYFHGRTGNHRIYYRQDLLHQQEIRRNPYVEAGEAEIHEQVP